MTDYSEMEDWQLFERIEVAMLSGFSRRLLDEVMRRYEPHADLEKPPDAIARIVDQLTEWSR